LAWALAYLLSLLSLGCIYSSFLKLHRVDRHLLSPKPLKSQSKLGLLKDLLWPLFHHLNVVVIFPLTVLHVAYLKSGWPLYYLLSFAIVGRFLAIPILAIVCYLQGFKKILTTTLLAYEQGKISLKEFCLVGTQLREAFREFSSSFGGMALLVLHELLFLMLFAAFFVSQHWFSIMNYAKHLQCERFNSRWIIQETFTECGKLRSLHSNITTTLRFFLASLSLAFLGIENLFNICANVHQLQLAAAAFKEKLAMEELTTANGEEKKSLQVALMKMSNTNWALDVHGYLSIDRKTVPKVLTQLLGLVVLLIQFKSEDEEQVTLLQT